MSASIQQDIHADHKTEGWQLRPALREAMQLIATIAIDTPPYFGAWCSMPGSGTVSFAGFWPNLLYTQGTVTNIAFWSWARSRFARQVIGTLQ